MQKRSSTKIFILFITILIIFLALYLHKSPLFEKNAPKITLEDEIYWNLKDPLPLKISDESGVKFLRVTLSDDSNSVTLFSENYQNLANEVEISLNYPKGGFFSKSESFTLKVEAIDGSKWNFFRGNSGILESKIIVDKKSPILNIVANSYKITKGGAALVVFKAEDENLKELYIKTNFNKIFKPLPFYKEGYYFSLIAWPRAEDSFQATIVATDKAKNKTNASIRFFLENKKYRNSNLALKESFIGGKISELAREYADDFDELTPLERFIFVNETLRNEDEKTIEKITSKVSSASLEKTITPFYPLKNAAAVASFGDYRTFTFEGKKVSHSYHLGLDLASTAQANIVTTNPGKVVFAQKRGIYGNSVIIDHGLGLYSLYSHCSSLLVSEGDEVKALDVIGRTGVTGLALGDHLHFGMIVQGVEVRPEEWMDSKWMNDNVYGIFKDAKALIDRQ
ncbi:MAG: M23 family metallopeptidase [Sulfurospirillaceae bacterium]|jgi:murein DD-endopeptidase MepM/ murein hydrolase activator NlpD|nr:M23 family metallopeptidase [Sulfurospirillaceae bacterium]MDY0237533.1 M23 family metallopeptidase [Campylobacterales bacterium]